MEKPTRKPRPYRGAFQLVLIIVGLVVLVLVAGEVADAVGRWTC